jgi:hypothetical protein
MARITVCGYMLRYPVAGMIFAYLHWVLGLERLGHEVVYVEESGDWNAPCFDPVANTSGDDPSAGLRIVRELLERFGSRTRTIFLSRADDSVYGASREELDEILAGTDLLVNVGGVCWLPEFEQCPHRALVDMDPLFTQVGLFGGGVLDRHDTHWTYGANVGRPGCDVPLAGVAWRPVVPPVVPDFWQTNTSPASPAFTTIATWDAYGAVTHEGRRYGQKDVEFARVVELPRGAARPIEVALKGGDDSVRAMLRESGWQIRDAHTLLYFDDYRAFLTASSGEVSVAKHAYVATRSGWFSDRSVCYLAASRPVVLQDTGFSQVLPGGEGVLWFDDVDGARAALEQVASDPTRHQRAAREIARAVFDYREVLPRFVEGALSPPSPRPDAAGPAAGEEASPWS